MARDNVTFADLVAIARRVGVEVVEAPSSHRGKLGEMGSVVGTTNHYTGTPNTFKPTDDYPDFNVVKEGRPGLENSLSAFGLGRRRAIYVFSEYLSWHAGQWLWQGVTDGNGHFLGTEAAGVGDWTEWQRKVYPRLQASILLFIDSDATFAPTHAMGAMPRGRKTDFLNTNSGWLPDIPQAPHDFHGAIRWLMANPNYININYNGGAVSVAPKEAIPMRQVQFTNVDGTTPDHVALLTVDSVGDSLVMPKGARAWLQWGGFYPDGPDGATARLQWLVLNLGGGKTIPLPPRDIANRESASIELAPGTDAVEIRVQGIPEGGVVAFHIDGLGHA